MSSKNTIIEKSFCLFLDKGFSNVSITDIIQSAGLTKGGFYHYFSSKEELIHEVIKTYLYPFFQEPLSQMKKELHQAKKPISAEDKLRLYYNTIHKYVLSEELENMLEKKDIRNFYFLVFEGIKKYEDLARVSQEAYEEQVECFYEILEEGKKEGAVSKNLDAKEWAITINALKNGLFSLKMFNDSIDLNQKCSISFKQICSEIIA